MKYKKYILLGYFHSGTDGGVEDIRGSFDTHKEALDAESDGGYAISYIIDRDTWEEPVKSPTPEERIATATDAAIGMVLGQKETP